MSAISSNVLRIGSRSVLWRPREAVICVILLLCAFGFGIVLLGTGTLHYSPAEVLGALTRPGTGDASPAGQVIWRIRLPRVLTALLVGASLGMAGAIFQSISRNPLGSPDVIGFTTGAATGAIAQIVLFNAGPLETARGAVIAGMGTAAAVFLLSRKRGAGGGYRLILVGIGFGAIMSGVNTVLLVKGDLDQAMSAQIWLAGSLNTRTWWHVLPAACGLAVIAPVAFWHARRLSLMEMGDDIARQLGVRVEMTRLATVLAAVGLTSIATAAAGPIAFIALAAPQLARRLTRAPALPLLSGALMGGVLLLAADLVSQNAPFRLNMPIGLTTGLLGGLYMLWLLTRWHSGTTAI